MSIHNYGESSDRWLASTSLHSPIAPDSLPTYLADGLPHQDSETLTDVIEYAEALIEERHQPVAPDGLNDDGAESEEKTDRGTIVTKLLTCGDETCHCLTDCEKHGPYRYRDQRSSS